MAIDDVLAMLAALEDTDTSAIQQAVTDEFNLVSEGANARIKELEDINAQLASEMQDVKARNFDLMTAAAGEVKGKEEEEEEALSIDDLIKEV